MLSGVWVRYLAVVLLLGLGLSSASAMWGDLNAYQAKRFERRWEKPGSVLTMNQWNQARSHLETALMFSPNHPDYLQSMGRLYSWLFFVPDAEVGQDQQAGQYEKGVAFFQEALVERPYWPYAWSELTLFKAQLGQVDQEFWQAFVLTQQFGPWERRPMINALNAGLGVWDQLTWMQRGEVQALFEQAISQDSRLAKPVFEIAERHGMAMPLCASVGNLSLPAYSQRRCGAFLK